MNSGRMTAVITKTQYTTSLDSYGSAVQTGVTTQIRAIARPVSSYERMVYGLPVEAVGYSFQMWYKDAYTLKVGSKITYNGNDYTVNSVEDYKDRQMEIHVIATKI